MLVPVFFLQLVQAVAAGPADFRRFGSKGDTTHPPGGHALPASSVGCLTVVGHSVAGKKKKTLYLLFVVVASSLK